MPAHFKPGGDKHLLNFKNNDDVRESIRIKEVGSNYIFNLITTSFIIYFM